MNTLILNGMDFSENRLETIDFDRIHTESIAVSPASLSMTAIGQTSQLVATVYPSDSQDGVTFRSTDENVATVSGSGLVEVVGVGSCSIIASSYNKTSTCSVSVTVELSSGKYRSTYANAANANNMLTSVATASSAGAADVYMLHCDSEETYNHLMINTNMVGLKDGIYDILLPSEMSTNVKRVYNVLGGYPIPITLPPNTTKVRCIAPSSDYAVYPLIFKSNVRAAKSGSGTTNKAYCSPARALTEPMSSYSFVFQESTDIEIPSGYDSVAIGWKANSGATDFRNMSDSTLAEFKLICM